MYVVIIKGVLYSHEILRSILTKKFLKKTFKIITSCFCFFHLYDTWVMRFLFTRERTIGMKLYMVPVMVRVGHFVSGRKKAYHSNFQPKILVWHP